MMAAPGSPPATLNRHDDTPINGAAVAGRTKTAGRALPPPGSPPSPPQSEAGAASGTGRDAIFYRSARRPSQSMRSGPKRSPRHAHRPILPGGGRAR